MLWAGAGHDTLCEMHEPAELLPLVDRGANRLIFQAADLQDAQAVSFNVRTHGSRSEFIASFTDLGLIDCTVQPLNEATNQFGPHLVMVECRPGTETSTLATALGTILVEVYNTRSQVTQSLMQTDFRQARGELPREAAQVMRQHSRGRNRSPIAGRRYHEWSDLFGGLRALVRGRRDR